MSGDNSAIDPVELAAAMIRCPSVTPADEGALGRAREHACRHRVQGGLVGDEPALRPLTQAQ